MAEEAPSHILINMIGSDQTSREIINDSDILILLVVLITPTFLRCNRSRLGSHHLPSLQGLIQSVYDRTFSASVRHNNCHLFSNPLPPLRIFTLEDVVVVRSELRKLQHSLSLRVYRKCLKYDIIISYTSS